MSDNPAKLSEQIRRAVEATGLSRERLCRVAGIDRTALSRFMCGRSGLNSRSLDTLAAVLNLQVTFDITALKLDGENGRKNAAAARHRKALAAVSALIPTIKKQRASGGTFTGIAENLNAQGKRTRKGCKWTPAAVRNALVRAKVIEV